MQDGLTGALSTLGDAALVDRAFIWGPRPDRPLGQSDLPVLLAEWWRPRTAPHPGETVAGPQPGWEPPSDPSALAAGPVSTFAAEWRPLLSPAARSAVIAPVTLPEGTGWVGIEDVWTERTWSSDEVHVVRTLATLVGLALARETAVEGRRLLSNLVEQIPAILYIDEIVGREVAHGRLRTLYVTPQIASILGVSAEEWMKDDELWQHRIHPDDWERAQREFDEYLQRGGTLVQEYRIIRPDTGQIVWIRDDCTIVGDRSSESRIIQGVMLDITDQKQLEEQLRASEADSPPVVVEQIPPVAFMEPLGEASEPPYVSSSVETVFGCSRADWTEANYWALHVFPDDREEVLAARQALLVDGRPLRMEYRMMVGYDCVIWIEEVAQVVSSAGKPWMLQGLLKDITKRKVAEEDLVFHASHDVLTGLPNRATFEEHLERALARAVRKRLAVAVLFMDIDGFKEVNDTLGREAGDDVLREVAERLSAAVRDTDIVARRGGDEFLVLLADIEPGPAGWPDTDGEAPDPVTEVADMVTGRVRKAMEEPVLVSGVPLTTSISVGRSIYPLDASDFRSMMAKAGAAMYKARQSEFQEN